MKWFFILVLSITISCDFHYSSSGDMRKNETEVEQETAPSHHELSFGTILSLTKSQAVSTYGKPSFQEKFVLDDLQGEFRIGLFNIYTNEERLSESIQIEECTWEKNKDFWITVWYEAQENQSVPVDTLTWRKGSEF